MSTVILELHIFYYLYSFMIVVVSVTMSKCFVCISHLGKNKICVTVLPEEQIVFMKQLPPLKREANNGGKTRNDNDASPKVHQLTLNNALLVVL